MKGYAVDVDLIVSKRIYVEAENEEQAKAKVGEMMKYPHYYYTKADAYVGYKIIDVNEDDDY